MTEMKILTDVTTSPFFNRKQIEEFYMKATDLAKIRSIKELIQHIETLSIEQAKQLLFDLFMFGKIGEI